MQLVSPSPAARFVEENAWLKRGDHTPVLDLVPTAPDTVEVVVHDGWTKPDEPYYEEMSQTVADHAAGLLEPVVDGVKLLVRTESGYVAKPTFVPSPDEQYFATNIPGVTSQFYSFERDLNGDGTIGAGERGWEFTVDSPESAARIDRLIVDRYGWDDDLEPVIYTVDPEA